MEAKIDLKPFYKNISGKQYLMVSGRVAWFRDDYKLGQIGTEIVSTDPVIVKATICVDGVIIATGHGSADESAAQGKVVWKGRAIEKAETAAIGRALANAGYGIEVDDEDDNFLADSPVAKTTKPQPKPAPPPPAATQPTAAAAGKPAVEPDYAAMEAETRRKAVTDLDNENVTIYKVTYNPTHNGMGAPSWTALAHDANGTSLPITVGERGAALVKKAGHDWPTTDGEGLAIDVITEVVEGKRRINRVMAIDGSWMGETPKTAEKPTGEANSGTSSYIPNWTVIYSKVKSLYDNPKHMGNSVQALFREGAFTGCRNDADAINIVIQHKNGFAEGKTG